MDCSFEPSAVVRSDYVPIARPARVRPSAAAARRDPMGRLAVLRVGDSEALAAQRDRGGVRV